MDADNSLTGEAGWFMDDFMTPADDVVIENGQALAFASQGTTAITFSGEVANEVTTITTLESGFTMVGNNSPVAITLGDLELTGATAFDEIQFLDENGATSADYFYVDADNSLTGVAGWFMDDFMTSADDVVIAPGAGFFYGAVGGAVTIKIPAAL